MHCKVSQGARASGTSKGTSLQGWAIRYRAVRIIALASIRNCQITFPRERRNKAKEMCKNEMKTFLFLGANYIYQSRLLSLLKLTLASTEQGRKKKSEVNTLRQFSSFSPVNEIVNYSFSTCLIQIEKSTTSFNNLVETCPHKNTLISHSVFKLNQFNGCQ